MVHLPSLNEMRKYWSENRDSLLEKYSDGFLVIHSSRASHYKTLEEVYQNNFMLKRVLRDKEILFGTLPMLIDVREELDSERIKKENPRGHNPQLELLKHIREERY